MSRKRYLSNPVLILVIAVTLTGCNSSSYEWGWFEIIPTTSQGASNLRFLAGVVWMTLSLSLTSIFFSILIGLFIALTGISESSWLRWANRSYVEIFRSIPILVLILWVYYGLPVVLGISLNPFSAGIVALALSDSAFEAEIFRGGIQSIERGLTEAADALGLTYFDKMRYVVLPIAVRRVL